MVENSKLFDNTFETYEKDPSEIKVETKVDSPLKSVRNASCSSCSTASDSDSFEILNIDDQSIDSDLEILENQSIKKKRKVSKDQSIDNQCKVSDNQSIDNQSTTSEQSIDNKWKFSDSSEDESNDSQCKVSEDLTTSRSLSALDDYYKNLPFKRNKNSMRKLRESNSKKEYSNIVKDLEKNAPRKHSLLDALQFYSSIVEELDLVPKDSKKKMNDKKMENPFDTIVTSTITIDGCRKNLFIE